MNTRIVDNFDTKLSCIMSGEFYNAAGATWQPFFEQTQIASTIQKTNTGCLEFDVKVENEININITFSLISSLSLLYRST